MLKWSVWPAKATIRLVLMRSIDWVPYGRRLTGSEPEVSRKIDQKPLQTSKKALGGSTKRSNCSPVQYKLLRSKFKINLIILSSLNDRNKKLNASIEAKTKVRTWFAFCPSSENNRNKLQCAVTVKVKLRKGQKQVCGLADLQLVMLVVNHVWGRNTQPCRPQVR